MRSVYRTLDPIFILNIRASEFIIYTRISCARERERYKYIHVYSRFLCINLCSSATYAFKKILTQRGFFYFSRIEVSVTLRVIFRELSECQVDSNGEVGCTTHLEHVNFRPHLPLSSRANNFLNCTIVLAILSVP